MYEEYYGFREKPFTLTPDLRYLYRSRSHAGAFELLQYAIQRREGFAVVTGDIGAGKTTLCRAVLEQIDGSAHTAIVLNPFLTEKELLKIILQDFGVLSRDDFTQGRLADASTQTLIEELHEFLLGLLPTGRSAVVVIDEAQNLPLQVLEQIRILSNLETEKDKLLQIVLVGQTDLEALLRSPELRQLDQRISIRYKLEPLNAEETAAYVLHRLSIAGGSRISFSAAALQAVYDHSQGLPRLINLICDRALLGAYAERAMRVTPEMVAHAVEGLGIRTPARRNWLTAPRRAAALVAAGTAAAVALAAAMTLSTGGREAPPANAPQGAAPAAPNRAADAPGDPVMLRPAADDAGADIAARPVPESAAYTIVVASYPANARDSGSKIAALTSRLEQAGYTVYYADVDLGDRGAWRRVLVGAYADVRQAQRDEAALRQNPGLQDAWMLSVGAATQSASIR